MIAVIIFLAMPPPAITDVPASMAPANNTSTAAAATTAAASSQGTASTITSASTDNAGAAAGGGGVGEEDDVFVDTSAVATTGEPDPDCKKYFEQEGKNDMRVIFSMAIGLKKKEEDGQEIPLADVLSEPYKSAKNKKSFVPAFSQSAADGLLIRIIRPSIAAQQMLNPAQLLVANSAAKRCCFS